MNLLNPLLNLLNPLRRIQKIGKILRGGAGPKEILLGTLCGVLIGFNPGFNLTLLLGVLLALLFNANFQLCHDRIRRREAVQPAFGKTQFLHRICHSP